VGRIALPELSNGVVRLRPWRDEDVPAIVAACQDPEIPRWTMIPAPYGTADAAGFLLTAAEQARTGEGAMLAVVDERSGTVLGSIGVTVDRRHGIGEIGYWVAAEERGRGVATQALHLLAAWALEALGLARLELTVHPPNAASRRVAEKAGFECEGLLRAYRDQRGERVDLLMYSLLPGELRG
jgi:RimJ/RimL family protein N-acetyltransferase